MNKLNTPSGFRDLLPKEAKERDYMIQTIISVYQQFGFAPLDTPVAEFEDIIIGDKADDFNLYRLSSTSQRQSEGEKEEIALRFDLTVPLARVVSQYGTQLPRPFKRYQVGSVFRGERPQKGRYRQFLQCDADIVGAKTLASDAEVISMIPMIMKNLGVVDFVVRVNTRTLLSTLPAFASFAENLLQPVLVALDKSEKINAKELRDELSRIRVNEEGIQKLVALSEIYGPTHEVLAKLESFFAGFAPAQEGLSELRYLAESFDALGVSDKIAFDMRIIRGFGYYTGPVFETNLLKYKEYGSVISGGRYDNLTARFTNQSIPAVGVSVGVDRLLAALQEMNAFQDLHNNTKVVVFSADESIDQYALYTAQTLRELGLEVDVYSGGKRDFRDGFSYAESVGASHGVLLGLDEWKQKTITIKNLNTREQKSLPLSEVAISHFINQ